MNPVWSIEAAECGHIPAMLDLWRGMEGVGLGRSDEPASLELMLRANPDTCLNAFSQGEVIGTILGGFDGRRGMIYHLAVADAWRRRGLGTALLSRCLDALHQRGAWKVNLFVYVDNTPALGFYQQMGWKPRQDVQVLSWEYSQDGEF